MLVGDTVTVTVNIVAEKMDEADYCLLGYENCMLVERKGGIRELAQNCLTNDRERFRRVLKRMAENSHYPVLLIEGSYAALLKDRYIERPYRALDALLRLLREYNIEMMLIPAKSAKQRAAAGIVLARMLINAAVVGCNDGT